MQYWHSASYGYYNTHTTNLGIDFIHGAITEADANAAEIIMIITAREIVVGNNLPTLNMLYCMY